MVLAFPCFKFVVDEIVEDVDEVFFYHIVIDVDFKLLLNFVVDERVVDGVLGDNAFFGGNDR